MKRRLCALAIGVLATTSVVADSHPSADDWYKNDYALTYQTPEAAKSTNWGDYFADTMTTHGSDGSTETSDGASWLDGAVDEWIDAGWLGSKLVGYESDTLNDGTVTFKAKWKDAYEGGEEAYECGWYLANLTADGWRVSQYAGIDCEAHGL